MFRRQFETRGEHNGWRPGDKAAYLIAALNEPAAHILLSVATSVTYGEVTEVVQNRYVDHHRSEAFHAQLRRRVQHAGEHMQGFSATMDHSAQRAHVSSTKHNSREAAGAFAGGLREKDLRQQLLLGAKGH
jgi:hypothetical protein